MIHVYIRGRLGNQLFQYAFVRMLQKYNPEVKVCYHFDDVYSQGGINEGWENSLKYFNTVDVEERNNKSSLSLIQRIILWFYWRKYPHKASIEDKHIYQIKWVKLLNRVGLYYLDLGYFPFFKVLKSDVIVSGNFECDKYFSEIKEDLIREIIPKMPILETNKSLLHMINKTNSVCISIRRGDFVDNSDFSTLLNVCTKKYFEKAIKKMKELVSNAKFFFFSDDINWVKDNISIEGECYYENGADPVWEKLRLMYSCKHFIISNSTFSWWAQYLGRFSDKIVIAPSRWYNSDYIPDIIQSNWIKIDVD